MKLALLELRRRPSRFLAAGAILFLLAGLLVFLGGLVQGLNANTDGVLRTQRGDLVVFADSAERSLPQSIITADQVEQISAVDGVAAAGLLSIAQLGARRPGADPRDLLDLGVVGFDLPIRGADGPPADGDGLADTNLRERGVELGATLLVGPARTPIRVVGFVPRAGFQGQGSLWVAPATFADIVAANAPGDALPPGAAQAVVVQAAEEPGRELADRIGESVPGTEVLTVTEAAEAVPDIGGGVLQVIIGLTVAIAVAVVALFFALLTSERVGLYGVLKAIGARNRTLLAGVLVQSVILAGLAAALAVAAAVVFAAAVPADGIPFVLTPTSVVVEVLLLLLAAALGASLSLRRVVRIDPANAIGAAT